MKHLVRVMRFFAKPLLFLLSRKDKWVRELRKHTGIGLSERKSIPYADWKTNVQAREMHYWRGAFRPGFKIDWLHVKRDEFHDFVLSKVDYHNAVVVDLGSGPNGVLAYMPLDQVQVALAIDSLAHQYKSEGIIDLNSPRYNFTAAMGENLPLPSESVGLLLCSNSLDHMQNPPEVVNEIMRVLKKGGVFFLEVHCFEHMLIPDGAHPYDFTPGYVRRLVKGFEALEERINKDRYAALLRRPLT